MKGNNMNKRTAMKFSILLLLSGCGLNAAANDRNELRVVGISGSQDLRNKVISGTVIGQSITFGPDGPRIERNINTMTVRDMTPEEIALQDYRLKQQKEEQERRRLEREQRDQEREKQRQERKETKRSKSPSNEEGNTDDTNIIVGGVGTAFEGSTFQNCRVSACSNPWGEEDSSTIRVALNFSTGKRRIMDGPNDLRPGEMKNSEYIGSSREAVMRKESIN